MSSSGQSSMPTALTASNSSASSPGNEAAAIQLADSFTSDSEATPAAARLVMASPTAMRADAAASISASGVRSPIAIASPAAVLKPVSVTATSASGSCQGPTIWSREHRPPTLRSPMVTRKFLDATVGCAITRRPASRSSSLATSRRGQRVAGTRWVSRCMRGELPNSTSIGRSIGRLPSGALSTSRSSAVATPTTANTARSRRQIASKSAMRSAATPST